MRYEIRHRDKSMITLDFYYKENNHKILSMDVYSKGIIFMNFKDIEYFYDNIKLLKKILRIAKREKIKNDIRYLFK